MLEIRYYCSSWIYMSVCIKPTAEFHFPANVYISKMN
jgi:hypothetical protein